MTTAALKGTTVKVSPDTRDRLNAAAAAEGLTAGSMIERLLSEYLWRQEVELAKRQMLESPPEVWAEYVAEFRQWEATANDGLEDDPWTV
ncbi:MAG: hypothetical protein WCG77_02415 [Actinomycetes bacterium]|jgi:hypothetical protein